jgi:hypothetical protein
MICGKGSRDTIPSLLDVLVRWVSFVRIVLKPLFRIPWALQREGVWAPAAVEHRVLLIE